MSGKKCGQKHIRVIKQLLSGLLSHMPELHHRPGDLHVRRTASGKTAPEKQPMATYNATSAATVASASPTVHYKKVLDGK